MVCSYFILESGFIKYDGVIKSAASSVAPQEHFLWAQFLTEARRNTCIVEQLLKTRTLYSKGTTCWGLYQTFSMTIWALQADFYEFFKYDYLPAISFTTKNPTSKY